MSKKHPLFNKQLLGTVIVVIIVFVVMWIIQELIGNERIAMWIKSLGARGPIGIILWKALSVVFAPLSGATTYFLSGSLFGVTKGRLYVVIGDSIGMVISFRIARKKGHHILKKFVGKKSLHQIDNMMHYLENKKVYIATRFLLFRIEDLLNYAAGLSKMNFRFFLPVSIIITTITSGIFVWIGYFGL